MQGPTLILMRHGQSIYNKKNLFTGWIDVDLSLQGEQEAKEAGEILKKAKLYPDICFTSWLKRAIHTAQIALKELEWEHIDAIRSYKLNERHYGAWQGQNKNEILARYGEETFWAVRRGYDTPPPKIDPNSQFAAINDAKYKNIPKELLPLSESLKDTRVRVEEYYNQVIKKSLRKGQKVLISAHGNSLRSLVMFLENLNPKEVLKLEIPTGEIIVYYFNKNLEISKKEILTKES